jgi:hypothetical protein
MSQGMSPVKRTRDGYFARRSMSRRSMRACGRIPILQDEAAGARQRKHGESTRRAPQKNARGTKIRQTKRKTCESAELV